MLFSPLLSRNTGVVALKIGGRGRYKGPRLASSHTTTQKTATTITPAAVRGDDKWQITWPGPQPNNTWRVTLPPPPPARKLNNTDVQWPPKSAIDDKFLIVDKKTKPKQVDVKSTEIPTSSEQIKSIKLRNARRESITIDNDKPWRVAFPSDAPKINTIIRDKPLPNLNFHTGPMKEPTKRAGAILEGLHKALVKDSKPRTWAMTLRAGDSVEVVYKDSLTSDRLTSATGVVIGISRPQSYNATLRLLGVVGQSRIEYMFPFHSPMVKDIRLLQKAFIKKGKRRVRRSKLYYLKTYPLSAYRVALSQQTLDERAKVAMARKKAMEESGKDKKGAPKAKAGKK